MDKEQVRQIIREELSFLIKNNKLVFSKPMQILDGNDIVIGQNIGSRFGTAASQKMSWFGVTPRVQLPTTFLIQATGGTVIDNEARARIADLNEAFFQFCWAAR